MLAAGAVLLAGSLLPAALANLARTDEYTAAFDLRTVARAASSVDCFAAVLLGFVVSIMGGLVGGRLVVLVVSIFVHLYIRAVVYHLYGRGSRDVSGAPMRAGTNETTA